jgi:hypothetical protein
MLPIGVICNYLLPATRYANDFEAMVEYQTLRRR